MQNVPQIKAAYDWMIFSYEQQILTAQAKSDAGTIDRLDQHRSALERGIFVLLFGQFENSVTSCFEDARNRRVSNKDWRQRRGWDVPSYGTTRVQFETKLALVLDREHPAYGKVLAAYSLRNHCAHGGTNQPVGSIDDFVNDLYSWHSLLSR